MQTVIGAFDDRAQAQQAVDRLVQLGIPPEDLHVEQQDTASASAPTTSMREDASAGDAPRQGFFASLFGMDDDESDDATRAQAATWEEAVHRGTSVVVVDAGDEARAELAANCLRELGAVDVDARSEQWRTEGWTGGMGRSKAPRTQETQGREGQKLDVVQEELRVGKRAVETGGVRVFQRVTEKPVREIVQLREERAFVERRPVDREVSPDQIDAFKEGSIELREMSEQPVVGKTARVVEEVRVGKQVQEREATVEDKVRRKDVEVERMAANNPRERAVAADETERMGAKQSRPSGTPAGKSPTSDKSSK